MAVILLDVDGVVAECVPPIIKAINKSRKNPLLIDELTEFNFMNSKEFGLVSRKEERDIRRMFASPNFARSLELVKGSKEGIERLRRDGHDLVWVTTPWVPSTDWCHSRYKWLKSKFGAEERSVIYTHDKFRVKGDVMIDDRVENCIEYQRANKQALVINYNQPWNLKKELPPEIKRATWDTIPRLIRAFVKTSKSC